MKVVELKIDYAKDIIQMEHNCNSTNYTIRILTILFIYILIYLLFGPWISLDHESLVQFLL